MGDNRDEKKKSRVEMENLGFETSSRFSRDLLNRFMGSSSSSLVKEEEDEEEEGDVELNLGLSLGGRFGVDKSDKKLIRSSSIAACLPTVRDDDALAPPPVLSYPAALVRTSSLPVETEEEWRKRKELQTLRRMEAKRRRSEKQRNLKSDKESGGGSGIGVGGGGSVVEDEKKEIEMNLRGKLDKEQYLATAKRFGLSVSSMLAAVARQGSVGGGGVDLTMGKGKGSCSGNKMQGHGQPRSQGSVESQCGGSSSSMSELESKAQQGSGELSPASIHSLHEGASQDVGSSGSKMKEIGSRMSGGEMESPSKTPDTTKIRAKEAGANALGDMPCVFTKGDGPNGRRVDGILYKYGKGEEVRIMCVCHGSFHSPAEFVKHAGGTDVAHPLKHIVVNPNPSPFL